MSGRAGCWQNSWDKEKLAAVVALNDGGGAGNIGPIFPMNTFIVNLVGRQGKNYLKVKLELELENESVTEIINRRLPQFRDAVITMLSNKGIEEINTLEGKFQLRAEILSQLNQFLQAGKIINVYFTDFIIQ